MDMASLTPLIYSKKVQHIMIKIVRQDPPEGATLQILTNNIGEQYIRCLFKNPRENGIIHDDGKVEMSVAMYHQRIETDADGNLILKLGTTSDANSIIVFEETDSPNISEPEIE